MEAGTAPVKVFIAEDSAPIRQRVGAMLSAAMLSVVGEGDTPARCISGIRATRPDVVILDIQLEGGTGLEVLRTVKNEEPGVAFVVFSNSAASAYRKRYMAEGASDFLDKATEFDRLAQAVIAASHHSTH